MLNGHGDDLHLIDTPIEHNFSSNVFYKGCPKELTTHLASKLKNIQSYPSPAANELSNAAAKRYNLSPSQFLFTNGAIEAFYLIAQQQKNKHATIVGPTFSEYEDACRIHGLEYKVVAKEQLSHMITDLVFICNPNNPTGSVYQQEEIEQLLIINASTLFVIDEAYIEFTNQTYSVLHLTEKYDNLIIVRSLTKTFTIPGLRLGYIVASKKVIDQLRDIRIPWSVNGLAIEAGAYLFENYDRLLFDVADLYKEANIFREQLKGVSGIEVITSSTTYFLVKLLKHSAKALKDHLIKQGILIRDATNFTLLEGEYIRLSVQSPSSNQKLINCLKAWN
ncbi:pyridoxal phosphate-dependent aminotransferase [Flammeovirga kamogawensis]|uniref:Aminotransferase class I/II-fold pyridoxal phosphate-dependent enzyme n=1 Tax=Flammeovirga kamogawensis TaxID=373891 RepID=A0ABX8H2J9_9BACT|nr:aminotransferase class I/II-fold pyridoxal phosphate-dependent enzyme [Flammeovirga kamogawensis]MBB6460332.1 threonine-phosphate decarboxylase [Flammeovirga kamogawensis]QWG10141.1 aminotransferase class I/II-fold pyridoxal phosphate-dependent enzyme [Flammeovirga kamogawensis]TRX65649.1 aminotransferase class I/II-fold pyridoxal phosphate-dependent enzyme [Flammeovirga kamogawensis]